MTEKMFPAIVAWLASIPFTRDITVAYTGVSLNLLVACAIGTFCSFSFGEKIEPRSRMWGLFVACMFMGAAFTSIVNAAIARWLDMTMTDGLQAGVGTVVAFVTRFALPWIADVVAHGKWLKWVPFIRSEK